MKPIQGSFIIGYVSILIKGDQPELFFQKCSRHGITIWDMKKHGPDLCEGKIKLADIKLIKKIRRGTGYKVSFVQKSGYPFLLKRFLRKRPLMIGLLLALFVIIFLSNIIWEVKITGVPKDIEEKISKQLNQYGVHPGAWIFSLQSPNEIQQQLVKDVPELLWVGVDQKGTTFYLEGVEKIIVKEIPAGEPRNLVAKKNGVIKELYVSKGIARVKVNDYVEKGDLLVSGVIGEDTVEDSTKGLVAADGLITANTWYEVSVTVPLEYYDEQVTGNNETKYYLKIGDFQLPVWGFGSPDYTDVHRETREATLRLLKWESPVKVVENVISEKTYNRRDRTKEEAIQIGIDQAKADLQLELGPEAKIMTEKILHESIEHGKVKLHLYITVEENIGDAQLLNQGD
ncbi:sporulation protein YqfD [Oceanobacillus chungangensis]|uniref:Sporulation protein YqfD n=1 Tax=Oceanobacillus chungangensis TaxID=1229152 RepID=A0A3D8Q1N6_9BACI|nr:sporulation protein YqfD [Oceanobacillus chungangensis]RDW21767.1 sporulation protein YqfD [Oceanobacillus chungangensis]